MLQLYKKGPKSILKTAEEKISTTLQKRPEKCHVTNMTTFIPMKSCSTHQIAFVYGIIHDEEVAYDGSDDVQGSCAYCVHQRRVSYNIPSC